MDKRLTAIVRAKITDFKKKMAEVNAISKASASSITKKVDADTRGFTRKMRKTNKATDTFRKKSHLVLTIEARTQEFTRRLSRVARTIRAFGTVIQNTMQGTLISVFSAAIPVAGALATAIASIGPIIGVAGGEALGLASGMAAAGAGAAAFGAVAIPALSKVFKAESNIKKAQDAVNNATTNKEREKALDKLNAQWASLSKSQVIAVANLESFKTFWSNMTKQFQDPVFDIFAGSLEAVTTILQRSQPVFSGSIKAANGLINSLNASLDSPDIVGFFNWLGRSAGPALTSFGKIAGNTIRGVMNLFVAFDPLAKDMESGLESLTKRFAEWTSGLTQSAKFESFIEYVQTNGPKLMSILGNITDGLVGMFVGFAPATSDMLTGLDKLTEKFKNWGQTLSQNKAFQNFIDYVRTNGPQVMDLIGNLAKVISDLVKDMAPLGAKVLKAVNNFLKWTDAMLKAHPTLGKILGIAISLGGALQVMIPIIIAWRTAFSGAGKPLLKLADGISDLIIKLGESSIAMISSADSFITNWVKIGASATKNAAIAAAAWAKTTGKQMATAVASMAKSSALFIAKWVAMGAKSLAAAARIAAAWVISMGPIAIVIAAVVALVALIILNWDKIKAATIAVFNAVWAFIKTVWDGIKTYFTAVFNIYKMIFSAAWDFIKKITMTVFNAVSAFIKVVWNAIKAYFTTVLGIYKTIFSAAWNFIKSITTTVFNAVWSFIKSVWAKIKSVFTTVVDAIKSFLSSAWNSIKSVTSSVWNGIKNFFANTWSGIKKGAQAFKNAFISIWNGIKSGVRAVVNPILGFINKVLGGMQNLINALSSAINKIPSIHLPGWLGGGTFGIPKIPKISLPRVPSLDVGTNKVKKDGLAMIHQGEAVVPKKFNPYTGGGLSGIGKLIESMHALARAMMPQMADVNGGVIGPMSTSRFSRRTNTPTVVQAQSGNSQEGTSQYAIINIGGHEAKGVIKYFTYQQQKDENRTNRNEGRR